MKFGELNDDMTSLEKGSMRCSNNNELYINKAAGQNSKWKRCVNITKLICYLVLIIIVALLIASYFGVDLPFSEYQPTMNFTTIEEGPNSRDSDYNTTEPADNNDNYDYYAHYPDDTR